MPPERAWRAPSRPDALRRSLATPGRAARSVLEHDAVCGERAADALGLGEIPRLLRSRAFGNQCFDASGIVAAALAPQELLRIPLQQSEGVGESAQLTCQRGRLRAVHLAGEFEQHRDGYRRV